MKPSIYSVDKLIEKTYNEKCKISKIERVKTEGRFYKVIGEFPDGQVIFIKANGNDVALAQVQANGRLA